MNSSGLSWLTIGISLAVIVIYLPYIIASIRTNRSTRREVERFQRDSAKQAELAVERIQANAAKTIEAIGQNGEETRKQIAETHLKITGRPLEDELAIAKAGANRP